MSEIKDKHTVGAADKGAEQKNLYGLGLGRKNSNSSGVPDNPKDYVEECIPPGPVKDALRKVLDEKPVEIVPDPTTAEKMGQSNKPLHACITEIVDNSLDARTDEQLNPDGKEYCVIDIVINEKVDGSVRIKDNARGMDAVTLQNAFRLGHSTKRGKNFRGLYGFGLKTSAIAIGPTVEVITQPEGSPTAYAVRYDPKDLTGWQIMLKTMSAIPGEHGTDVNIPKRRMMITPKSIDYLNKELGTAYYNELTNERVKINVYYGSRAIYRVKPVDHTYAEDGQWKGKVTVRGEEFEFMVGVIEQKRSVKTTTNGFEIFFNNRKVEERYKPQYDHPTRKDRYGDPITVGITDHPSNAKIYGRLYLDSRLFEVNTDKTGVLRNVVWDEMNHELADHPLIRKAKTLAHKKKKEEEREANAPTDQDVQSITDNINKVLKTPDGKPSDQKGDGQDKDKVPVEHRTPGDTHGTHEPTGEGGTRKPRKTHLSTRRIRSDSIGEFDLEFFPFQDFEAHLTSAPLDSPNSPVITLQINTGHKNFEQHPDHYTYAYEETALALMIRDMPEIGSEKAVEQRGKLINKFLAMTKAEYADDKDVEEEEDYITTGNTPDQPVHDYHPV